MRSQGTLINIITARAIRNQLISILAGTYMGAHGIGADLGTVQQTSALPASQVAHAHCR